MFISNYKSTILLLAALILSGCEWALGPLPVRTNPIDLEAPVAYFRATPQHNGGSMDEVRLTWNWGGGGNPGTVRILRRENAAPAGSNDSSATLVYRSEGDSTLFIDDFGDPTAAPDQTGRIFYYTLFYEDEIGEVATEPSLAVFILHTAEITLNNYAAFSFYYSALPTPTYGAVEGVSIQNDTPNNIRYAILLMNLNEFPAYNIDITRALLEFESDSPSAANATFSRSTSIFSEDQSPEYYFSLLTDPANYDTILSYSVGIPSGLGTLSYDSTELSNNELIDIMDIWLSDLNNYGLRIESDSASLSDLSNFSVVIDYVGP